MQNLPFAVMVLAGGGFCAILAPIAILRARGSVLEKMLPGLGLFGGACSLLGFGGLVIASGAGAAVAVTWLGVLTLFGLGLFVLAFLTAFLTSTIWRRVAAKKPGKRS